MDYNNNHLQKIQEYRALIERPKQPKSKPLGDAEMIGLPNESISLLIRQLSDERPNPLPDVDIERLCNEYADIALTQTDVPTPFPVTKAVVESQKNTGLNKNSIEPTVKASNDGFIQMANELLPFFASQLATDDNSPGDVLLALWKHHKLDRDEKDIIGERLNRIHREEESEPYKQVTATELARTFSDRTLSDAKLVTRGGVGVMYSALIEMLEEQGMNPDHILPHGYLDAIADEGIIGMMQGADDPEDVDLQSLDTVSDLIDDTESMIDPLKENVKHLRDCYFLRELYDDILDKVDIENPNCPRLVWKEASLDVQNSADPYSADYDDEEGEIPSEKLMKVTPNTNNEPSETETTNDTNQSAQAGLSDF